MARYVMVSTGESMGRGLGWMLAQTLHGFMDVVTFGFWIPIHIRSNRKIRAAFLARSRAGYRP